MDGLRNQSAEAKLGCPKGGVKSGNPDLSVKRRWLSAKDKRLLQRAKTELRKVCGRE